MSDDIVTRLNTEEMTEAFYKAFPIVVTLEDAMRQALEAADEIERLRKANEALVKMFKQVHVFAEMWQKTEDELIEIHHGKCLEQFAKQQQQLERLRKSIRHLYFNEGVCYGENCEHCETIYGLVRGD